MKDKRNFLYKELLRVMADKKPKFFMAENVNVRLAEKLAEGIAEAIEGNR